MPSVRTNSPGDGARSSSPPGRRTTGASPSAGSSSCHVKGSRLLRRKSSIRMVAADECGPTICNPSPATVCSASRLAMKVVRTRSLSGPSSNSSSRRTSRCDRDVAQRLRDHRGDEHRLTREQVQLAEEPGRAVADDLLAGRVDDGDLALDDRDERVPLIADAVEHVADIGRVLVTELSQGRDLQVRQHRTVRRCHRMSLSTTCGDHPT